LRRRTVTNANSETINTVEGNVTDIEIKKDVNGKEFVTVSIQQDGLTYATNVRSRDTVIMQRMGNAKKHLDVGTPVWLRCEVKESPRSGGGVFRDITQLLRASLDGTPQEPGTEDSRPAPAKAQTARPPSADENQMRIMRQSTLGYAATSTAGIVAGYANPEALITGTIEIAKVYLSYVLTGEMPSFDDAPEQPIQAQESNVDLPADPLGAEDPPLGDLDELAPEVFEV
jgi:hypothetical protein